MGFFGYVFLGKKKGREISHKKGLFQAGSGYQSMKLRHALKKGCYKPARVHRFFGKNWTT